MPLKKLFKSKRKLGGIEPISKNLPEDSSGILAREFPYLASRAKSPTDVLDLVGYPQFTTAAAASTNFTPPPITSVLHRSSQQTDETSLASQQQQQSTKPIRPTVGPRRASFHSFLYDQGKIGHSRKRSVSTPPPLMMPKPVNAIPPTQDTVLQSTSKDKTQVASSPSSAEESGAFHVARSSCTEQELESIYQQLKHYQQEQQEWLKREKERRQREDWMYAKLCELQQQLQQLSTRVTGAGTSDHPPIQLPTYSPPFRKRQPSIRLEDNEDDDDLEHEACYLSVDDNDQEDDEASSGYASEEEEEESEHDDDDDTARRRHYYYYYRHPATAAAAYQHQHRRRPWSSTMMVHPYYHHPQQYHAAHYAYPRGSWPHSIRA
ncbi:hypothetical protein K492DRAFT_183178 [Lichtheimia hyalospora FSU 10163]|nr:hypothetical protein K492DRAFT_183178 [Lichtheimia hyalospora FSU 10163]